MDQVLRQPFAAKRQLGRFVLVLVVALLELRPFVGELSLYQKVAANSQLFTLAGACCLAQPGGGSLKYFLFDVR